MKSSKKILLFFTAFVAIFLIFQIVELVRAGSLNPTSPPAGTMHSLENIFSVLGGTYDASGVTANANGSVLEQLKAIKNGFGM